MLINLKKQEKVIHYLQFLHKKVENTLSQMYCYAKRQKTLKISAFNLDFLPYLQCLHLILESLVLRVQVFDAMLSLAQLSLQLGLQLPASLLKLQQLLLRLLTAAEKQESLDNFRQKEVREKKNSRWKHSSTQLKIILLFNLNFLYLCEWTL